MEWSPQQDAALCAVNEWLKEKNGDQIFRLFGFAGTGKTTLAKTIAENFDAEVRYGAFTGKAASVMRKKGCFGAQTIHSMIYRLKKTRRGEPVFELDEIALVCVGLVIIDECSMVDDELAEDLLSFGKKVLVLGDPAQLPPIKGAGFFTSQEPDVMLSEVHRQARDNPIIRMSMRVREGHDLALGLYGDSKVISRAEVDQLDVLKADQVIVGLNRTRQGYNRRLRELRGFTDPMPCKDDKLICLRNDRKLNIFNGSLWRVNKSSQVTGLVDLEIKPEDDDGPEVDVCVLQEFFLGTDAALKWDQKRGTQEFTYGYAITCHKSQGSQWNNVIVFDESAAFREDAKRWLYTALTRGAEKVTIVK